MHGTPRPWNCAPPFERMHGFRASPFSKIPDVMARRCDKFPGKRRGWIDEQAHASGHYAYLSEEVQALLSLYARLE